MPPKNIFEFFQYAVGDESENIDFSTQLVINIGTPYSIIIFDTFTKIKNIHPLVGERPEKSPLAANGLAVSLKEKVVIQSAFDVEYTCVIENMIYASDLPEAPMIFLRMDILAKFVEFDNLRNPMLISIVFPSKCVKLSTDLDKLFKFIQK